MELKFIQKECKNHGLTDFVLEGRGYYRCKECRVENVTKSRRNKKTKLVENAGGCCSLCGYNKCQAALQFHHIDPNKKEFGLSEKGLCRNWETLKKEAEKCILICANCHAEIHHELEQNKTR